VTLRVPGALFSLGDVHAAQGDGEVGGTGIEVGAVVTVRLTVLKRDTSALARGVTEWQLLAPSRLSPARLLSPSRDGARHITTGFSPDLRTAARKAVFHMTNVLMAQRPGLSRESAYMICSLACDLRISQLVDVPHYSVAAHLPMGVLDK